jgi:cell division transport system permease protein
MRRYSSTYFVSQAFKGIFRNGVMSFASVAVLMSCLVVLGGFALLVHNININLEQFGLLNEIEVFVNYNATEEEIVAIEEKIRSLDNVAQVVRTTRDEAFAEAKAEFEGMEEMFENDPQAVERFSDSFTVTYEDNDKVVTLAYVLNQIEGVRKVNNRLDLATKIASFKQGVLLIFTWFLLILFVVTLFVIINTIKLSVFSRRNEISIMRYVGATGFFITMPFLLEGIIIGLFASGAAYLAEWYFYLYIEKMVVTEWQMISIVPFDTLQMPMLVGFLGVGVVAGIVGSSISLGKYLKA